MLTVPEVKPFLVHEDRSVRDAAVDYFEGSWSKDPDLVPLVLRAYRQYGPEDCTHAIACCRQFQLTLQSIDEVLDCLAAAKEANARYHLNRAIAKAPVDVLWTKEAAIFDTAHVAQETANTIRRRLEFSQWSPDKLWAELYDYAPNESWGFRNFSSAVLANIKHQESEDALLALLDSEPDATIRTMLCVGLCKLFSRVGVGAVRREIARGYDRFVDTLEDTLLPIADVLGEVLPEADRWRKEREQRERRQAERQAELDELGRRYQAAKAAGFDPLAKQQPRAKIVRKPQSGGFATMRREPGRVGRNDPCPCGSGKKYKKCCGRNAT